jgi:hypothetical protein
MTKNNSDILSAIIHGNNETSTAYSTRCGSAFI